MTQPPVPPQGPPPDQPPRPPFGPPGVPWYGPPQPPVRSSGSTNLWLGIIIGGLIGGAVGLFSPIWMLMLADPTTGVHVSDSMALVLSVVLPVLLCVPLLPFRPTRPWGIGLILGLAGSSIVMSGLCYMMVSGYQ